MKFVIKSGSTVKLYSGQMKIEALAQFLKENFASWNSNNLTYKDQEGDKISLTTQEDLEVIQSIKQDAQYLKLQISDAQKPTQEQRVEEHTKQKRGGRFSKKNKDSKKQLQIQNQNVKKSTSKSISKPKDESRRGKWRKHQEKRQNRRCQSSSSYSAGKKESLARLEDTINKKIAQIVDSRIKSMIPCITNQLEDNVQTLIDTTNSQLKHEGINCNGCNLNPISGIRYKCLICPNFNLCVVCEEKIQHQHNLLKMKKPQEAEPKNFSGGLLKLGKKFFRQINNRSKSSSETQGESHGRHHRRIHGHGHGHGHRHAHGKKHGFNHEQKAQHRFNKRMFKLVNIFGERQNLKEFIEKNQDIRARDLIEIYATQNSINQEQVQQKRDQMRKEKLSAFYDCPQNEFDQIVKQNPKLGFRQLIMKLKETGKRTYTGENFKRMREACRKQWKGNQNKEEKKVSKSKSKRRESPLKYFKPLMSKGAEMKLKGLLLNDMKSLFGEIMGKEYFKFIEQNFQLGQQGIIAKWIDQHSQ